MDACTPLLSSADVAAGAVVELTPAMCENGRNVDLGECVYCYVSMVADRQESCDEDMYLRIRMAWPGVESTEDDYDYWYDYCSHYHCQYQHNQNDCPHLDGHDTAGSSLATIHMASSADLGRWAFTLDTAEGAHIAGLAQSGAAAGSFGVLGNMVGVLPGGPEGGQVDAVPSTGGATVVLARLVLDRRVDAGAADLSGIVMYAPAGDGDLAEGRCSVGARLQLEGDACPPPPPPAAAGLPECAADVTLDGIVDVKDIVLLAHMIRHGAPEGHGAQEGCPAAPGDLDGNGVYNVMDVGMLQEMITRGY